MDLHYCDTVMKRYSIDQESIYNQEHESEYNAPISAWNTFQITPKEITFRSIDT